jgi:hypothetical protein
MIQFNQFFRWTQLSCCDPPPPRGYTQYYRLNCNLVLINDCDILCDFHIQDRDVEPNLPNLTLSISLQITQLSCYDPNLPPAGCTQYYTGTSGTFNSYNYANGVQLANQQQTICMRYDMSYCN